MRNGCAGKSYSFKIRNRYIGKSYSFKIRNVHIGKDCKVMDGCIDSLFEDEVVENYEKSWIDDLFEDDEVMKTHENP